MEEIQLQEETFLTLNKKYRITSDGSRNLILQEKYFKRDGRGKGAKLTKEEAWKDVGYFGASLQSLIRRFNDEEFLQVFKQVERGQDIAKALQEMRTYLDEREQRIYEHVDKHVTLMLKNMIGSEEDK